MGMDQVAASELVVRPWTLADAPALTRAITDSVEHLRPWMPWAAGEPVDEATRSAFLRDAIAGEAAGGDRLRGWFLRDVVVGGGGLHQRIGAGGLEIGYWVRAAYTRRGVATAAVHALVAEAFADPAIDRVEILHDRANAASGRVAAAAGFTLVGEIPRPATAPAEEGVGCVWRLARARVHAS
jgi:RimJ/RimL family protein N-acetyltransferase